MLYYFTDDLKGALNIATLEVVMKYLAFDRSDAGCYSAETICVEGVHVGYSCHYCHHNDDYGDYFSVLGACDGSCCKKYRPYRYDEHARPPKHVDVPDCVVEELVKPFLATGEKRSMTIPHPGHELPANAGESGE